MKLSACSARGCTTQCKHHNVILYGVNSQAYLSYTVFKIKYAATCFPEFQTTKYDHS